MVLAGLCCARTRAMCVQRSGSQTSSAPSTRRRPLPMDRRPRGIRHRHQLIPRMTTRRLTGASPIIRPRRCPVTFVSVLTKVPVAPKPSWVIDSHLSTDEPFSTLRHLGHSGALTGLTRNRRLSGTVSRQTGHTGSVMRSGESDRSRLLPQAAWRIACSSTAVARIRGEQ